MVVEEERWVMHGLQADDPHCIRSVDALEEYILQAGFLPLFKGDIPGFSVEEITASEDWWTGDDRHDPWEWRKILAARGNVAYGKFFDRKAGFISREWFPYFANYRRDGYDFDARWDDELASIRSKKIMDLFMEELSDRELFSNEVKQAAGFGKSGEKNFEGEITNLQMQTYLCIRDFRCRRSKSGKEYGWGIAVYCTPEHLWGYDHVTGRYEEDPAVSAGHIFSRVKELVPEASERQIRKTLGLKDGTRAPEKKEIPYPENLVKALKIEGLLAENMTPDQLVGLQVAVGQLRDKQQRVIRMKYVEHKKNEEIGKIMNRAAGTIGTYHTKALGKLRWHSIRTWYMDGYRKTLEQYLSRKKTRENTADSDRSSKTVCVEAEDYCLRIGMSLKQFDALAASGIQTISDLEKAVENPAWYRTIKGIGPKSAEDIERKLAEQRDIDIVQK